jgi:hypothetical protein
VPVVEYTLPEDLLLDDSAWGTKPYQVAKAGEAVKLKHCLNYGLVIHPDYGTFRY